MEMSAVESVSTTLAFTSIKAPNQHG